ncbi:anti-anti-sigma regulatory factor [Actinocorallia herbida]|uniref:Anti-anti-sigma regulatory factor n=1 Tax=Actinocorallia herbida TaxID=58109 RepID=A0A3N1DAS9_9ACTN|nr:STAS domain-containing protein [Actinocorallia herbida]ROO90625.1 anti-anti-sigma regulatory factor [Actinocorallia herbida]
MSEQSAPQQRPTGAPAFRATTLRYGSHRLLMLAGTLDASAVAGLEAALLPLLQEEVRTPLIVDLEDAVDIADVVHPTLMEAARLAAERNVTMTFGCSSERLLQALRAMGALRFMSLWESTPDAVEAALTR